MITESERQQNIARVVESARKCFLKYGIEKTMQIQIAEGAGLSAKSVKRYFPSRQLLVHAVSKEITANWQDQFAAGIRKYDKAQMTGLEKLQIFFRVFVRVILKDRENLILIETADFYCRQWAKDRNEYWGTFRESSYVHKEILVRLEEGIADGSITTTESPDYVVTAIGNNIFGYLERIANKIHFGDIAYTTGLNYLDKVIDKIDALI